MVHRYGGRARYYSDACGVVCVGLGVNSCCEPLSFTGHLNSLIVSGKVLYHRILSCHCGSISKSHILGVLYYVRT